MTLEKMDGSKPTVDGRLRDDEVVRRFPEVNLIDDEEVRSEAIDAIARATPDYFWQVPATSSGKYHNTYGKDKHGLWIHVKMVFTVYERLVRSAVEQGEITEYEADLGRVAVLLHDVLKYGHTYSDEDHAADNHDQLAAMWVRSNTSLDDRVADCIDSHNGPWYSGKEPQTALERLVHHADMVASTANATAGVYEPASEITEHYPDIPRANL